ncbi:MAG: glycosyltransferase [Desulfobulbaceae bacterium]|nr:glycosyltransferase [Desulfobulbaceae bacterium]
MRVSLIITTYNWKEALELSLRSALNQETEPVEIVVADDGSRADTRDVVKKIAAVSSIPIIHSWQKDKGFRLARSRNRAIVRAKGEYIILIDGDIILERHFLRDHCKFARAGYFVQGTRVLLKQELSVRVLAQGGLSASVCTSGVENRKNCLRSDVLARLFSFKSNKLRGIKTCNFSFWREDAIAINGFNEEFVGWGREDSEFTARLMNCGIRRQNVKFNALGYHLFHPKNDRNRLAANDRILQQTIEQKLRWCEKGIDKYLGIQRFDRKA